MKKKIIPLLLSLTMLSSCTIFAVDVNKAPDDIPPDPITSENNSSSSETSEETSSDSETSSEASTTTETGPIIKGLTYEEAQPIINGIKEYINANEPLETRYSSTIDTKAISSDGNLDSGLPSKLKVSNEVSDVYIDFNNHLYQNHLLNKTNEPDIILNKPKEVIIENKTNYIYLKDPEGLTFINATNDEVNNTKTYVTSSVETKEEINNKFTALTKMGVNDNKNLTLIALDLISSSKISASQVKSYDITSENETSISCEIEFDINISHLLSLLGKIGVIDLSKIPGIEQLGDLRVKTMVNISNYRLYKFRVAVAPSKIDYAIYSTSYTLNYQDKPFNKPDLTTYENKDMVPPPPSGDETTNQ